MYFVKTIVVLAAAAAMVSAIPAVNERGLKFADKCYDHGKLRNLICDQNGKPLSPAQQTFF
ncbi:hypothetical protein OG21DRAFT_1484412 [Imleria badia]|nr:hypothetical protein OG21DRAFT_1484412 [Imleria badia]